jgi:hypothetical protein
MYSPRAISPPLDDDDTGFEDTDAVWPAASPAALPNESAIAHAMAVGIAVSQTKTCHSGCLIARYPAARSPHVPS